MFNDQDYEFDNNKLTSLDSVTINRDRSSDNELARKKYIDDELDKNTILRFNEKLENNLKVSSGNVTCNLTKYDKILITDITFFRNSDTGGYILPLWKIFCIDKNGGGKLSKFIKATKSSSPGNHSGATTVPRIGDSFMYIVRSSNNRGNNVFVSFERTDTIQISNITIYYNRFSILTHDNLKSMGRIRIQLFLEDNTCSTQYTIAKNIQYGDNSTDWTLFNLIFTTENYGINIAFDQIETAHSDMCFSNITRTHSV